MERLSLHREEAIQYYAEHAKVRKEKFNANLAPKNIKEGSLVLRYNNRFDYNKSDKFVPHWEGPFKVNKVFDNGAISSWMLLENCTQPESMDGGLNLTSHRFWKSR